MKSAITILLLLMTHVCLAQIPQLVKDINPGKGSVSNSESCVANGKFFFNLNSHATGGNNELWVSDGTDAGTFMLHEFKIGSTVKGMEPMGSKMYFVADDSLHGREVWVTDGTISGTSMVKDVNSAPLTSSLNYNYLSRYLTAVNGKIFFPANDGVHNMEIWVTDGTGIGTYLVKDINPDTCGIDTYYYAHYAYPGSNCKAFNKFFFAGDDGVHGNTLWVSDGSATGTQLVTTDSAFQFPIAMMPTDHLLFFDAMGGLCVSDGTTSGTKVLSDSLSPITFNEYASIGDVLYYIGYNAVNYTVCKTDGTIAGTRIIVDSLYNTTSASNWYDNNKIKQFGPTILNNKLLFSTDTVLWVSDGTKAGTKSIFTIGSHIEQLQSINSHVYFKVAVKNGTSFHAEIYSSDGTDTGTKQIVYPGENHSGTYLFINSNNQRSNFAAVNNTLYFFNGYDSSVGIELYKLDIPADVHAITKEEKVIKIWPNPVTNSVQIKAPYPPKGETYDVTITSTVGQVVFHQQYKNTEKMQIDVHSFAAGIYFIQLNGMYAGKFVKE